MNARDWLERVPDDQAGGNRLGTIEAGAPGCVIPAHSRIAMLLPVLTGSSLVLQ